MAVDDTSRPRPDLHKVKATGRFMSRSGHAPGKGVADWLNLNTAGQIECCHLMRKFPNAQCNVPLPNPLLAISTGISARSHQIEEEYL